MDHARIDLAALQGRLQAKENLPLRYAAVLAESTLHFDERLLPAVEAWMRDKLSDDFAVEDCSLADIRDDTGATQFEAICMLNMQLKNPEQITNLIWAERSDDFLAFQE